MKKINFKSNAKFTYLFITVYKTTTMKFFVLVGFNARVIKQFDMAGYEEGTYPHSHSVSFMT